MKHDNTVEATLQVWQQQVDQVRPRRSERGGGHAGLAGSEQVQGLTGLQVMLAVLEGDLPHPDMVDTFDCELVEVGERACGLPGDAAGQALQPAGIGAGGWYATLLDSHSAARCRPSCQPDEATRPARSI